MRRKEDLLRWLGWNVQGDLGPWTFYTSQRKGLVFFAKAPPLEPPSLLQTHQRNRFRLAGYCWRSLDQQQQENWSTAAKRAHLRITGYNLFTFWIIRQDHDAIRTIEQQSRIDLIPLISVP